MSPTFTAEEQARMAEGIFLPEDEIRMDKAPIVYCKRCEKNSKGNRYGYWLAFHAQCPNAPEHNPENLHG